MNEIHDLELFFVCLAMLSVAVTASPPQNMTIDEIFSPDMFWWNGSMVVLDGVGYAADNLEGDEDRYVCDLLDEEFGGKVAVMDVSSIVHGFDHHSRRNRIPKRYRELSHDVAGSWCRQYRRRRW